MFNEVDQWTVELESWNGQQLLLSVVCPNCHSGHRFTLHLEMHGFVIAKEGIVYA